MGAVVPELDHVRHNPIARPVRWPGHGLAFEPLSLLLEPALEQSAGRKRARLVRRPCAQLRITGTAGEICRSEEHTSELQSLMRNSYAVFCLKKTTTRNHPHAQLST